MARVTVLVQGSDGETHEVLLDSIAGQVYAIPLYKISVGELGEDDGTVSSASPLPTTSLQGEDILELILMELRIMNEHLATVTGDLITEHDLTNE